ncbi:activating mRNAion factor 7-interacting protein 1 isoform X4 [Huso huso]|uniref:Activating mRNAion factor 7-interacting protein 1 isoform X4 n=1 Tax=Huso huso TaxID=61971 RepID=A0ABR0Z0T3_HUSHU
MLCNNESCHPDKKKQLVNKPKADVIAQLPSPQLQDRISPMQQRTHIVPAHPAKNSILKKLVLQNEKQRRSINSLKWQIVHLHEAVGSVTKVARELLVRMQSHYENEPLERTRMCEAIPEERVAYPGDDSTFLQEDSVHFTQDPIVAAIPAPLPDSVQNQVLCSATVLPDIVINSISLEKEAEINVLSQGRVERSAALLFRALNTTERYHEWTNNVNYDGSRGKKGLPTNLKHILWGYLRMRFRVEPQHDKLLRDRINKQL